MESSGTKASEQHLHTAHLHCEYLAGTLHDALHAPHSSSRPLGNISKHTQPPSSQCQVHTTRGGASSVACSAALLAETAYLGQVRLSAHLPEPADHPLAGDHGLRGRIIITTVACTALCHPPCFPGVTLVRGGALTGLCRQQAPAGR